LGSTYYVKDSYTLTVTGAPNASVKVVSNGTTTQEGTTNSSGVFTLSGTWSASQTGTYTQTWYVAGLAAPVLTFSVAVGYTISGTVTAGNGTGVAGVTITLSGSQSGTTTTSSSAGSVGAYSFTVASGGNFTVTATLANFTFNPSSTSVNNIGGNQTAVNFAVNVSITAPSLPEGPPLMGFTFTGTGFAGWEANTTVTVNGVTANATLNTSTNNGVTTTTFTVQVPALGPGAANVLATINTGSTTVPSNAVPFTVTAAFGCP
jgi:hypothetical protein